MADVTLAMQNHADGNHRCESARCLMALSTSHRISGCRSDLSNCPIIQWTVEPKANAPKVTFAAAFSNRGSRFLQLVKASAMSLQNDQRHKGIVARVEAFAVLTAGDTVHIHEICEHCGVTEHTLRKAFRRVYGLTPYRCLRTHRMRQARQALIDARPAENVTSIATQFGFLELGRFSVEYRAMFGERPSETLRRARIIQCAVAGAARRPGDFLRQKADC